MNNHIEARQETASPIFGAQWPTHSLMLDKTDPEERDPDDSSDTESSGDDSGGEITNEHFKSDGYIPDDMQRGRRSTW